MGLALILGLFVANVFAQAEKRATYGILFDNTGSMNEQLPRQQEIAKEVISQFAEQGPISIFSFATDRSTSPPLARAIVGIECSKDKDLFSKQIAGVSQVYGQTTLLDGIRLSIESLSKPPAGCENTSEKSLILMSDGEDRASKTTLEELVKILKEKEVKVYVVGLLDNFADATFIGKSPVKMYKGFLEKVAIESGGRVIFPQKKESAKEIVKQLFEPLVVRSK